MIIKIKLSQPSLILTAYFYEKYKIFNYLPSFTQQLQRWFKICSLNYLYELDTSLLERVLYIIKNAYATMHVRHFFNFQQFQSFMLRKKW